MKTGVATTAVAGSGAAGAVGAADAAGVAGPVVVGVGSPNVFVTVNLTWLERFVGESKVTESPEVEQLAFTSDDLCTHAEGI